MDFYEIRIFPIDKTIERQYMASYRLDMVGKVPYENHMKSIMAHRSSHIIPIYGPYMTHITQFGKGNLLGENDMATDHECCYLF